MVDYLRDIPTPRLTFGGTSISQSWSALYWIERLMTEYDIKYVVELGTGRGALTTFFALHCGVLSVDITDHRSDHTKATHEALGVAFMKADLYQEDGVMLCWPSYAWGRTLLFCDGGDKQLDFDEYGGDPENRLVLVHDVPKEFDPDEEMNVDLAADRNLRRIYGRELATDGTRLVAYERVDNPFDL